MTQREQDARARVEAGLEHWSFTTPSATLATRPWSEPSTMISLRTVSTIEDPSLRGVEHAWAVGSGPDDADPAESTPSQELPGGLLDREVPLDDLLPWELSEEGEALGPDQIHPEPQAHPSFEAPEPSAWRPPAPVRGEPATISFEDDPDGDEVMDRRPARSELSDPMKILQGIAGFLFVILAIFMT